MALHFQFSFVLLLFLVDLSCELKSSVYISIINARFGNTVRSAGDGEEGEETFFRRFIEPQVCAGAKGA